MANSTPHVTVSTDNLTVTNLGKQQAVDTLAGTTRFRADVEQPSSGHLYKCSRLYTPALNHYVDFNSEIDFDLFSQDFKKAPIPKISAGHGIRVPDRRSQRACYSCGAIKVRVSIHISYFLRESLFIHL